MDAGGLWIRLPSGAIVSCRQRRAIGRVLVRLATRRIELPGRAVTREELFAAGWPGERARGDSARNRVHVALSSLRRLGLEEILIRRDDGWCLDPALTVRLAESA